MSINKFISSTQIKQDFQDETGVNVQQHKHRYDRWITRSLQKLVGRRFLEPFICVLTFEGRYLKLPSRAVELEGMIWGDLGVDSHHLFDKYLKGLASMDVNVHNMIIGSINSYEASVMTYADHQYMIIDNMMDFYQNYDGQSVTARMWGYKDDGCGGIMVPEYCLDAVIAYMKWKTASRSLWQGSPYKMRPNEIMEFKREWGHYMRTVAGESAIETDQEQMATADMFNNPLSGDSRFCRLIFTGE